MVVSKRELRKGRWRKRRKRWRRKYNSPTFL